MNLERLNLGGGIRVAKENRGPLGSTLVKRQINSQIIAEATEGEVVFERREIDPLGSKNCMRIRAAHAIFEDNIVAITEAPDIGVITRTASDNIVVTATTKRIVSGIADQQVGNFVASQRIVSGSATSIFDTVS